MTIEKPAVGRSGWNTTIDEVIDEVNALSPHVTGSDPHGDRAYTVAQVAAHVAASDPHADRAYTDTQISTLTTTVAGNLAKASNLSDLASASTARTNLAVPADSAVVHNTGTETVAGVKTFTSAPVVPSAAFPESAVSGLTTDLAAKLALAGGALTGALTLAADPTAALGAATKQYVDAHGALNVLDNGVTAGSGTSQTTAINTLIAASSGKRLRFPAGVYRVDTTISVTVDDVHLDLEPGAVLDASNASTGGTVLLVSGTKTATTSGVTPSGSALYVGVRTVSVGSPTGFAVGDWVMITSTEVFNQERPTQYFKGEINQIASISGGTQFTLSNGLVDAYDTASNTVTMTRLVMLNRFTMTGGRILGKGAGGQQTAVRAALTVDPKISRVVVVSTERQGIVCETTVGGSITDCSAHLVNETGLGYGFKANIGARGTRIVGNFGERCRHVTDADSSATYPPCRGVTVAGNSAVNCISAGISTHGGAESITITGNTVDSCGGGIVSRAAKTTITGNSIVGGKSLAESSDAYRHGIWVADATTATGSAGTDLVVADNVISMFADYGLENVQGILLSAPLSRARISGNVVRGFTQHGIYANPHTVQDAVISGNVIDCVAQVGTAGSTASHGIFVDHANGATGDHAEDLTVEGNVIRAPLYSGVLVNGGFDTSSRSTAIVIRGNTVKGYGKNGVQLASGYFGRTVLVTGNIFPGATALGSGATSTDPIYFLAAQFLADPARINNIVDAPNSPPGDIVRSFDPALAGGTLTFTANEARYVRVEQAGTISKVRIIVGTASGNVCVGVYANSGVGLAAVPGARVATSGSVTCPASGDADVSFGSSVTVNVGDWLAIAADNGTATIAASPNSSAATTAGNGRHMAQSTAFPLPSSAGTVAGRKATMPLLIGVP